MKTATEANEAYRLPPRLRRAYLLTETEEGHDSYSSPEQRLGRAVADYVAGLTEQQAIDLSQRLVSPNSQSVLDPWMLY